MHDAGVLAPAMQWPEGMKPFSREAIVDRRQPFMRWGAVFAGTALAQAPAPGTLKADRAAVKADRQAIKRRLFPDDPKWIQSRCCMH